MKQKTKKSFFGGATPFFTKERGAADGGSNPPDPKEPLFLEKKGVSSPKKHYLSPKKTTPDRCKNKWSKDLNRCFSPEELNSLFGVIKNPQHRICFQLMLHLGLRICEAVRVNVGDINFEHGIFRVYSPKTKNTDFLPLVEENPICELLRDYVARFSVGIEEHYGYMIFTNPGGRKADRPHASEFGMRNRFNEYRRRAGLDEDIYVVLEPKPGQCNGGSYWPLRRLTTHSFRHTFICNVYRKTKNPMVTQALARHRSFDSTQHYIKLVDSEKREGMRTAYLDVGGGDFKEFLEFYEAWKAFKDSKAKE